MFHTEGASQELVIKPNLDKPTAFQKAAARITIISVLSRQVNTKSTGLGNETVPIKLKEIQEPEPSNLQVLETSANISMSSTNILPARREGRLPSVSEGSSEDIVDKVGDSKEHNGMNGNMVQEESGSKSGNHVKECTRHSVKDSGLSQNVVNGIGERLSEQYQPDPFDYMKERKLSEPVISPRKKPSVVAPKLTRCRSTLDLRGNEKPVILRELGGYKFFQKPCDTVESSTNRKPYENKTVNEVTALKRTVAEQKENIMSREKHMLHLEKKLAMLEHENSKNKKQILSFREKLKDCSGTVDYLRREKEVLATERDRLSFTLLTCEHELKELRSQNINLVTEYESAEHSRKIAVSHLHEVERVCQESHQEKRDHTKATLKRNFKNSGSGKSSEKINGKISHRLIAQLSCMKEAVQKLRCEREAIKNEQNKVHSFFVENFKTLVDQVREIESKREKVPDNGPQEVVPSEQVTSNEEVFEEPTTDSDGISELEVFKKKLKSNELCIDNLANQIRDLENRKKGLLETRFAMIQEFQANREVVGDWGTDMSGNDTEEKSENEAGGGDQKRSRVTRRIRKLERTLSMDHGVGKLDCIQKLCKKLEECEQRVHELETTNSELRAEHDDMEEEAKYLKYVLSYRGDVMRAQLQSEYETKISAMKDKLELAKSQILEQARSDILTLSKRNCELEEEVQRLHEELSTLLQNLPAFRAVQQSSSRSSEYESENSTISGEPSTNSTDSSLNHLDNSQNAFDVSKYIAQDEQTTTEESENSIKTPENSGVTSKNDNNNSPDNVDDSQNCGSETTVRSLEEKVVQLIEEKRVLLLSMQTLTGQAGSRENSSESDTSFSRNVNGLERNLREVEQENACLSETFQRIRDVLEQEYEHENADEEKYKILKLKDEMQRLDEKMEASRKSLTFEEGSLKTDIILSCTRHEERIFELEMEVYRLHEEKKSLLSSIVRLQTDPNFTLSDDVNNSELISDSYVNTSDVIDAVESPPTKDMTASPGLLGDSGTTSKDCDDVARIDNSLMNTSSRDEEVQVDMNRENIHGLLGYLQRDLDKLRTALDQEGIVVNRSEKKESAAHDMNTCPRQNSVQEVEQLGKELQILGQHTHVLEEKLQESESIRCDLHRTISIATDMATEERQKCEELTRTKAALEKEMLKLAKENRDLREGLETLSRAGRRRSSRAQHVSRASPSGDHHEDDDCCVMYLPRAKAQNFSESEFSDMDSPVVDKRNFPRTV